MDGLIVPLIDDTAVIEKVGGKAANLALMTKEGFPVPPAFAVTVDAYFQFVRELGLSEKITSLLDSIDFSDGVSLVEGCSEIRKLFTETKMPDSLSKEILDSIKDIDSEFFAVRSSAVAEDLPEASFAGQQDTFLNVPREEICENIISCWASYWNDRAVKYRQDSQVPHLGTGIAVVIQKMVDSEISGVMFTIDPLTGKEDIVIESSWGLGESIASGLVTPDRYTVGRGLDIKEVTVRSKTSGLFLKKGKNETVSFGKIKANARCASDEILKEVAATGLRLEKHFGCPQDVEWAMEKNKVYLLQSRPVTTLTEKTEIDDILWTRAYGDEYWADATTPLFYSTMGKMLVEYVNHEGARKMGYKDLVDTKLITLHKTRVYFNTEVLIRVFGHYPKFIRSKELLNYFPQNMQGNILDAPNDNARMVLSQIRVFFLDHDGMMWKTNKAYLKWAGKFLELCAELDATDLSSLSDQELIDLYWKVVNASMKHYRLIRYGMVSHSIATNLMVKNWLTEWLHDDGTMYAGLISGIPGNKTVETNIGFYDLSVIIRDNEDIRKKIDELGNEKFVEWMYSNPNPLREQFDKFIAEFGHRSNTREIMVSRWRENKPYVISVARILADSDTDLRALETKRREERIALEQKAFALIRKEKGMFKTKLFKIVLSLAQTYLTFRENQRFYLDHILLRQRILLRELGKRLVSKSVIAEGDDVFFLYEEEVFRNMMEPSSFIDMVAKRKKEFDRYKDALPPKFLKNEVDFDDTYIDENDVTIIGAASSPGYYEGKARVVASIEDLGQIQSGEILVTSNTDPGWTAVFSRLGALVTETGGILSHGAVVSREYRIPAVTAVKDATTIIKTGQTIIVDGNNGKIYIESEQNE